MRNHFCERKLFWCRSEKLDRHLHVARLARPGTKDTQLLAGYDVRIPRDRSGIAIVAEDEIFTSVPAHLHSFDHYGRRADAFENHVSTITAGQFANRGNTF